MAIVAAAVGAGDGWVRASGQRSQALRDTGLTSGSSLIAWYGLCSLHAHLAGESGHQGDLAAALRSLAADLSREIEKLEEIRARALKLAASSRLADSMDIWQSALQQHALLGETAVVAARERDAVELLDALRPHGIDGIIKQRPH